MTSVMEKEPICLRCGAKSANYIEVTLVSIFKHIYKCRCQLCSRIFIWSPDDGASEF